jgi:hypothetical protein
MRLASLYLLVVAARAFVPPVQQPVAARTTRLRAQEEATLGTAVRNIAVWLPLFLVEPALRIPNYKECVAEKGHEACANLLPSRAASSEKCLHRVDGFASMATRRWLRVDGATPGPQVLPVALRTRHRRRRLTHGYVILGPPVHLRAGHVLLQPV